MTRLDGSSLGSLPPSVAVPTYDRAAVRVGIVHLGVGGFHRSHQAMYLDRLMNQGTALDWGICGVGVLPVDARMRDVLSAQDCLWTLVVRHADGSLDARVIGSMVEYLLAPDDPEAVVERMADPAVRIVSLTVTEGGYNTTGDGEFDVAAPAVVADLRTPGAPRTSFGLVTEALHRRRQRGIAPFTVMSCDNVPHNGDVARRSFGTFAALRDPGLGEWVAAEVAFPNSMVDRITPATTDDDRAELARRFGVEDGWPVVCEPFTQWVLEDSFGAGRPPLEEAGVQLVDDVTPYEPRRRRPRRVSALAHRDRRRRPPGRDRRHPPGRAAGRGPGAGRGPAGVRALPRRLRRDLAEDARFAAEYRAALASLRERGARATVAALVAPPRPRDHRRTAAAVGMSGSHSPMITGCSGTRCGTMGGGGRAGRTRWCEG